MCERFCSNCGQRIQQPPPSNGSCQHSGYQDALKLSPEEIIELEKRLEQVKRDREIAEHKRLAEMCGDLFAPYPEFRKRPTG